MAAVASRKFVGRYLSRVFEYGELSGLKTVFLMKIMDVLNTIVDICFVQSNISDNCSILATFRAVFYVKTLILVLRSPTFIDCILPNGDLHKNGFGPVRLYLCIDLSFACLFMFM